jgi:hypothetical protein
MDVETSCGGGVWQREVPDGVVLDLGPGEVTLHSDATVSPATWARVQAGSLVLHANGHRVTVAEP